MQQNTFFDNFIIAHVQKVADLQLPRLIQTPNFYSFQPVSKGVQLWPVLLVIEKPQVQVQA